MIRFLSKCWGGIWILAILSAVVASLQFVIPLYMMAVYNRILQTKSEETLVLISVVAVGLLVVMGIAEIGRSRILALINKKITRFLNEDVFTAVMATQDSPLGHQLAGTPKTKPLSDLHTVGLFFNSGALSTLFDVIFAPVFMIALFVLHPLVGWIGVGPAVVIFGLALQGELLSRGTAQDIAKSDGQSNALLEQSMNSSDAVQAMGMQLR